MKIFKTWIFRWWEIGLIKLCLLSFGIILTIYFYDYFFALLWLWWIFFVVTTIYWLVRIIKEK